ncbi:MAG: HAMP domain-containing histidine kinase [Clostridia bacterium]|nr:HAMP domain-containing histidine kinase [Clostridia bacterium]
MRDNKRGKSGFTFLGALLFFALIALIMQIAILVYAYIAERTSDNVLIAILVLILIVILSAICTIIDIIRRKIMVDKPVSSILEATEKIASGDFNVRLEPRHVYTKYDEYDVIMENLNTMASELQRSEVLKTDFISNVSHEIKTPLAIIQSYAKLLNNDSLSSEDREKYTQTLISASKRLSDLISNILKLSKLENQGIPPERERISLTEALFCSILTFEELIDKRGIELICDFDEDVSIISSPSYLEIVWNNLMSNAIKFTPKGGKVSVSLKDEGEKVRVVFKDTGCGISREVGGRIFEKFYQGDTSHKSEGNGLGLALTKKVIDNLGGKITVESELGKGTSFTIELYKNA